MKFPALMYIRRAGHDSAAFDKLRPRARRGELVAAVPATNCSVIIFSTGTACDEPRVYTLRKVFVQALNRYD